MANEKLESWCWWRLPPSSASSFASPSRPGFTGRIEVAVDGLMESGQIFPVFSFLFGQILRVAVAVLPSGPPASPLLLLLLGI